MNKIITIVIALALGATLLAKDLTVTACTSDKKTVSLSLSLNDETPATVVSNVTLAFDTAARSMSAEDLLGRAGFLAFVANLSDDDRKYVEGLSGPPTVTGDTCQ